MWIYLVIGGIAAVVVLVIVLAKKEPPIILPPYGSVVNPIGSYTVHYQKWAWSGCLVDQMDAGTYWTNNVDGRTFYLGPTVPKPIDVYSSYPKTFVKEVTTRPQSGTCVDVS